jgi:FkbM family methyltransferase
MKAFAKRLLKLSPIPLSRNHGYDLQTRAIFKKHLQTDSHCVDVGCLKGEILDLMLHYAPKGRQFAFEPIPECFHKLQKKYQNVESCRVYNLALSNQKGTASFNHVLSNPSYSGLRKRDYDKKEEREQVIQVKTDLLDNLIPEGVAIDLIKIDVEGAELQVLKGAKRIVSQDRPLVIFEHGLGASEHYGTTPEMIFTYFTDCAMKISTLKSFLREGMPLTQEEFREQYDRNLNYYFIAHP